MALYGSIREIHVENRIQVNSPVAAMALLNHSGALCQGIGNTLIKPILYAIQCISFIL